MTFRNSCYRHKSSIGSSFLRAKSKYWVHRHWVRSHFWFWLRCHKRLWCPKRLWLRNHIGLWFRKFKGLLVTYICWLGGWNWGYWGSLDLWKGSVAISFVNGCQMVEFSAISFSNRCQMVDFSNRSWFVNRIRSSMVIMMSTVSIRSIAPIS